MRQRHKNIPIFVPHNGCPNCCSFCNQWRITGVQHEPSPQEAEAIIEEGLRHVPPGEEKHVEAAFFGGSFTAIPREKQRALLEPASRFLQRGRIGGIRLSTRPDCIDREELDFLASYGVTDIELGAQSMCDEVLRMNRRGHTAEDTRRASWLIRSYSCFSLGLQMMPGLYGDTPERTARTGEELIALKPDCVRIYPTLVLKDTYLHEWYQQGLYTPLTIEDAVEQCKRLLLRFRAENIAVLRMGLMASDTINDGQDVVAGPFHPAFGELVESAALLDELYAAVEQAAGADITLRVHSRWRSKVVGNRKGNLRRLNERFPHKRIAVVADETVSGWQIDGVAGTDIAN